MSQRVLWIFLLTLGESLSFESSTIPTKFEVSKSLTKTDTRRESIDALKTEPIGISTKAYGPAVSKAPEEKPVEIATTTATTTTSATTTLFAVSKSTSLTTTNVVTSTNLINQNLSYTPSSMASTTTSSEPTVISSTGLNSESEVDFPSTTPSDAPDGFITTLSKTAQQSTTTVGHVIDEITQSTLVTSQTATPPPRIEPKVTSSKHVKPSLLSVRLLSISSHELLTEWDPYPDVSFYSIIVEGRKYSVTSNETSYRLEQLIPGHRYSVSVRACADALCGEYAVAVNYTYPATLSDIQLEEATTDSLTLVWFQEGVVEGYVVMVDGQDHRTHSVIPLEGSGGKVTGIIRDLKIPGEEYRVSIQPCVQGLCAAPAMTVYNTAPAVPSHLLLHNSSVESVGISWIQSGIFSNFSVSVDDPHAEIAWSSMEAVEDGRLAEISGSPIAVVAAVRGLSIPGHLYNVTVRAWSRELSSGLSSILVSTNPSRPNPLQLVNRTKNSLIVSWHQIGELDGLVVSLNKTPVKYPDWTADRSADRSRIVKLTLKDLPTAGALYNISVSAVSHYITGLTQWKLYRTVPDTPALYCSAISNISISICPRSVPMISVTEFKYTTKLIQPSTVIGDTTGIIPSNSLQNNVCKQPVGEVGGGISLHGWILTDLIPGATYSLSVQSSIEDLWSEGAFVNCTTHTSPPSQVSCSDINETEVRVSWRKPQGHYNGFKVTCVGGTWNSTRNISNIPILVAPPVTSISADQKIPILAPANASINSDLSTNCYNLTSGALYKVIVSTLLTTASPDHISSSAPLYHVTTPNAPLISATAERGNSLVLRIFSQFPANKTLCTYFIRVSTLASEKIIIDCSQSVYTVTGLTDNSPHTVAISVQSSHGPYKSQESKPSTVTAWTLPGSILGLSVSAVGYSGLNISWIQPNRRTSMIGYRITVSNATGCCEQVILLSCNFKIDLSCDNCNNADIVETIDCGGHELSYVVQSLESSSNYSISVASINVGGMSERVAVYQLTASLASYKYIMELCGAVFGCLFGITLAVLVIFIYIRRRQPKQAMPASKQPSTEVLGFPNPTFNVEMDELMLRPKPVPVKDFVTHVARMHKDSDYRFSAEFALLGNFSIRYSQTSASLSVNRVKNRYSNILAYDTSRVKLITIDDDEEGSDYINASYVPGYSSKREFIATQGPLKSTVVDYWRMIWEQNIHMIVMLTNLTERNKEKCFQYWPYLNEPVKYGSLEVQLVSEKPRDDYTLRNMTVRQGEKRRTVKQMQFHTWADFGCPESTSVLLNFVRIVRRQMNLLSVQNPTGPILVHCSAGVGRTGTFILVDRVLQLLPANVAIDIFGIVLEMRGYRPNMIQTEAQYIFAHECIRTAIEKQIHLSGNHLANNSEDENDDSQSSHSTEDDD